MAKKIARNRKEVVTSQDSATPWPIEVQQKLNSLASRVSGLEAQLEDPESLFRGAGISPASMKSRIEICEARLRELEAEPPKEKA